MLGSQVGELARAELWHKIQPHDLGITMIRLVFGTRPDDLLQPRFKKLLYCLPLRSDVDPLLEGGLCGLQLLSSRLRPFVMRYVSDFAPQRQARTISAYQSFRSVVPPMPATPRSECAGPRPAARKGVRHDPACRR